MNTEVTAKDWYRCGFIDGRNGNSSWAPKGEFRAQYLEGYRAGKEELRKDRAQQ